ncbi:WXG100-like domain-containing protein [Streptomyces olivaceoviridis]
MAALEGRWPKWVQELVAVLTGMYYPNVPHEKWFEMSNHLRALAEHYEGLLRDVSPSAALVSDALEGPTAEAFKAHVHKLKATLPQGVAAARDLSESLRETAVQVQYAKYMILVQLLWLAYTIVELVAFGLPEVAVAVTRGVAAVLRQIARQLVRAVATGAAVGGLMELGVQLVQMWQGFRDRLSWKDVFLQAGWGGVGGGLTALFGEVAHMYPVKPLGGALRDMSVGAFVAAGSLAFDPGQYKDDGAAAGESVAAGFLGSLPSGGRRGHGGSGPRLEALGGGLGWTLDPRLAGTGEWGDFHGLELPADGRDGAGVRSVWQSAGAGTGGDGFGAGAAGGGGWRDAAVRQGVPQPLITGFEGWVKGQGGLPERVVDRLAARAVASYVAGDAAGRAPGAAELHRWAVEELAVHRAQEGLDTVFGRWRESSAGSGLDDGALVRVHRYAARSLEERLRTGEYVPAVAGERSAGAAADRVLALAGFGRDQEHAGYGATLTAAADRERRIQGALGGFDRALAAPVAAGDAAPGAAGAGGTAPAHLSPLGHAVLRRAFAERLVAEHDTVFGQPGPFAGDAAGAGDAVRAWDREVRRQLDHLPVHTVTQAARELAAERAMDLVRTAAVDGTWLHGAQGLGEGFVRTFGLTDAAGSSASAGHVQQGAALHLALQAGHRLDHWTAQALQTAAGSAGSALLRHLAGVVGVGTRTGDLSAAQVVGQAVSEQGAARHLALAVARERAVSGAQGEAGTLARAAGLPAPLVTRVVGHHAQTVGELFDATFTRPDGDGPGGPGPVDDRLATWTERRTVLTRDLTGALAGGSGEPAASEAGAPHTASAPSVRLLSDSPATMPGTDPAVPRAGRDGIPGVGTGTGPSPLAHPGAALTRGAHMQGPAEASAAAPGTARTAGAATATAVPADAVRPAPVGGPGERPADAVPPAASDRPGPLDAGWDAAVREARAALEPYDRTAPLVRLAGSALARYAPQPLVIREPDDGYAARHEEVLLVLAHRALGLGITESWIGRLPEDHPLWQHAESLGRQLTAEGIPFDPSRRTGLPGGSHALAHPAAVRGDDGPAAPLPGLDPLAGTARTPGTNPGGGTRAAGPAGHAQDVPDAVERPRAADHGSAPLADTEARERRRGKEPAGPWGEALKAAAGKPEPAEGGGQREVRGAADPVQDRRVRERGAAWARLASAREAEPPAPGGYRRQETTEDAPSTQKETGSRRTPGTGDDGRPGRAHGNEVPGGGNGRTGTALGRTAAPENRPATQRPEEAFAGMGTPAWLDGAAQARTAVRALGERQGGELLAQARDLLAAYHSRPHLGEARLEYPGAYEDAVYVLAHRAWQSAGAQATRPPEPGPDHRLARDARELGRQLSHLAGARQPEDPERGGARASEGSAPAGEAGGVPSVTVTAPAAHGGTKPAVHATPHRRLNEILADRTLAHAELQQAELEQTQVGKDTDKIAAARDDLARADAKLKDITRELDQALAHEFDNRLLSQGELSRLVEQFAGVGDVGRARAIQNHALELDTRTRATSDGSARPDQFIRTGEEIQDQSHAVRQLAEDLEGLVAAGTSSRTELKGLAERLDKAAVELDASLRGYVRDAAELGGLYTLRNQHAPLVAVARHLSKLVDGALQNMVEDDHLVLEEFRGTETSLRDVRGLVGLIRRYRTDKAFAEVPTGEQWRTVLPGEDEHWRRLFPDLTTMSRSDQIAFVRTLSDRNIESLRAEVGDLLRNMPEAERARSEELRKALEGLPYRIKHATPAYHAIANSGVMSSQGDLARRGLGILASGKSSAKNTSSLGNDDFVFFRLEAGDGPMVTRYGPTTLVFDAAVLEDQGGWVSLHDQLHPLDRETMRQLRVGDDIVRSATYDDGFAGAGRRSRWTYQYPDGTVRHVSFEQEVFHGDHVREALALSVVREVHLIGGPFKDDVFGLLSGAAGPEELGSVVSKLYRPEAKFGSGLPINPYGSRVETEWPRPITVHNANGDGRYLADGTVDPTARAAGRAFDEASDRVRQADNAVRSGNKKALRYNLNKALSHAEQSVKLTREFHATAVGERESLARTLLDERVRLLEHIEGRLHELRSRPKADLAGPRPGKNEDAGPFAVGSGAAGPDLSELSRQAEDALNSVPGVTEQMKKMVRALANSDGFRALKDSKAGEQTNAAVGLGRTLFDKAFKRLSRGGLVRGDTAGLHLTDEGRRLFLSSATDLHPEPVHQAQRNQGAGALLGGAVDRPRQGSGAPEFPASDTAPGPARTLPDHEKAPQRPGSRTVRREAYGGAVPVPASDAPARRADADGAPAVWHTVTRPALPGSAVAPHRYVVSESGRLLSPEGHELAAAGWKRRGEDFVHLPSGHVLSGASGRVEKPAVGTDAGTASRSYELRVSQQGLYAVPVGGRTGTTAFRFALDTDIAVPPPGHGSGGDGLALGSENWAVRLGEARTAVGLLSPSEQQSLWRETAVIMQEHYPAPGIVRDGGDDYADWFDAVAHVVALELLHDTARPIGADHSARRLAENLLPRLSLLLGTPLVPSARPLVLGGSRARGGQRERQEVDRILSGRPSAPSGSGQGNPSAPPAGGDGSRTHRLRHVPGMSDLRSGTASGSGARDAVGPSAPAPAPPAAPRAVEARSGAERGGETGRRRETGGNERPTPAGEAGGRAGEAGAALRRGQADGARRAAEERAAVHAYEVEERRLRDAFDAAQQRLRARTLAVEEARRRLSEAASEHQRADSAYSKYLRDNGGRVGAEEERQKDATWEVYETRSAAVAAAKRALRDAQTSVEQAERALSRVREAEVTRRRVGVERVERAAGQAARDAVGERARPEVGQRAGEAGVARGRVGAERVERAAGQAARHAAGERAQPEVRRVTTAAEPGNSATSHGARASEPSAWRAPVIIAQGSRRPVGIDLRPLEQRSRNPVGELQTRKQLIYNEGAKKSYIDLPWGAAVDPFFVMVQGSPRSLEVAGASGVENLSPVEFAEFLAELPNLSDVGDGPIVLLLPRGGAGGLELPRLVAHHTRRTVWSFTSVLHLRAGVHEGSGASFISSPKPGVGPEPSGWWVASRPEDIGPDPAAVADMRRDPLGDIHHFAIVDAQGRPVGRIAHSSEDLVLRERLLAGVAAAETYNLRTWEGGERGASARQLPWRRDFPNTTPYFFSAHGTKHHLSLALSDGGKRKAKGGELAAFLKRRPSFNQRKDAPVVLTSCAAGGDDSDAGLAQIVANETGRVVYGATTATSLRFRVDVDPDGQEGTWLRFSPSRASASPLSGRARTATAHPPTRATSREPRAAGGPEPALSLESDDDDLPEHDLRRQAATGPDRFTAPADSPPALSDPQSTLTPSPADEDGHGRPSDRRERFGHDVPALLHGGGRALPVRGAPGGRPATRAPEPARRRVRSADDDPFAEDQERRRDIEVLRNRLRELANTPGPDDATRSEEVRRITEAIRRLRQSVDSGDLTEFLHSPLPRLAEGLRGRQRRIAQLEEQMSGRGPGGDTREARDEAAALRREAERIQEEIRRRPGQGPLPGRLVLSAADMRIARILVAGKAGHREATVLRQEANALGPAWTRTTGSDGTGTPQAASLADRAQENWALHSALAHRQVWQRIDAVQATHLVAAQRHARRMRDADRLAARERLLRVMGGVHDPRPVAEDGVTDLLDLVHEHLDTGVTLVSKVPLRDADTGATLLDSLLRRGAQTPLHELLAPGTGTSRHGNGDAVGTPAALVSERWQRHGADDGIGIVFHWDSTVRERTLHTLSPHPDDPGRPVTPSSRYALIAHGPADAVRLAVAETDRFASDRELLRRLSAHKPVGDAHFPARVLGDLRWSDVHRVVLTHADTPSWRRAEEFAGRLEDFAARHGLSFEVSTAAVRETPLDGPGPAPGGPRSLVTDLSSADGARIVGRDYRPAGERSVVKPTGLDTATVAVAVPPAAPGTSPLYEPGERGPAPWAGSGPEPFFVLAWGTPEHITVQESGGRTAALSPERFADLLAEDPVMAGTPRDRAIVLAMPYGGAGGLDLPRLLAARTGREVWSSTGPLEIVPDVVDSRLTGVITQFPSDASVTRGWWVLSRPADGATAQAGADALPRTDGAATATTDLVTHTMVGFDHRPIGRLSLPADFLARSEDIVDQGVWQATEGSSGQRFPWTGDVEAGRRPYFWMSHGWPTTVQMLSHEGDHHYPGAALGRYLRRRPSLSNLPADRPIVLLSCYTGHTRGVGERDTVVAQTVADATGRTVYAADSFVYVSARLPQGGAWHTFRPHRPEARQAQRALSSSLRDDGTDGLVLGVQDRSTRRETMSDAAGSFASADATVRNGGPADTHSRAAGSRAAGLQHSERTAPDGDPHAAGTKDPSPAGQTVRNHPTPDAPEPRPAPGDGVAPSSASPVRIDAELDTHRPPRLDRGMLPPAEGGRVVRFADGSRLPEYLTGDGGESRPATYGPSLVTLRGIDQVVREIGARTGLADSPARGARGAMADLERALRETPWVFHGDGYESASFQDRGQPRVLRVVTRPHGNWERFADGYGAPFKYENVDRSQTTTGLAKSLATSIRLSLGFSVGPPPGPVPAGWGRVGGAVGLNRSTALAQYDQTQKQDETRRGDASHVHLDDVQYEVHLAGPRPANRSSRPADAFSSGEAHFSFGVHSGLAVRLADGETTSSDPRSMADADRVPRSMTLGPHTDYRLVHTEGYGPVGEIRDWALRRVGAQPGSSAYDEITGFFSSANFQRMADRLAHGPVATGQLVSDDRGRTPLGVFVVERVVPGEAHLVTGTAAAELRGTVQRAIRNERTVSKAYTQELNATAGPTMSFGRFFGGRAGLRVVAGVSARYARTIAHGTVSGGTGSRKTTGQAKKVPTYLYRVSRTVSVRWTGDTEAKTFDTWSLDRMTRTEARRHAGWDDGTTLRRRHDNEPTAPLYLPVDDPMTLGAARPEAFTHEDGSLVRADDAGGPDRTLLDGLLHQVLHRAARAYPGMIAPLADFGDPSDARWKDAEHYRMALQNTLTVMNTLSHHSLAAGLESLVTTGVRVGLVVPGTFGRARRWLWIDGRLTDRRYEGTQNDLLVRSSLPGTERLDGQRDVVRGYDLGVDVSATVLDAHKNRVGAPKNTGSLQVGPRWAAQTGRRTGFGATVSTESGSGGTSQSHLFSYALTMTVSSGGFVRPRHLWRVASLGLLGTQAFVRRAETLDLVGGSAGDPVTGRVLLAVPGEHTPPPGYALADGPQAKPRLEVLAPARAKQIALGTGEGGAARNEQGPFGDLPHTPLSIAAHRELIAGAEDVMREASGGSWHFAEPGALAHEALVRPFEAPYLSGQSDLSSGPSGMRIAGLYAKGPYRDRLGTLLHRVRVLNPRVVSAPVKVETEHGLSGDLQVSEAVTTTQAFSVTVSGSYGHAHPVGPTVAGSYGALGRWSRQQARALTVSRVVTNETAIGDDSHKVLVVGDTQHDLIGSVRGAGVLSVPVSLLPDHFARWSGRRLTFSSDWLGHVPEKAAHRMGLLDDRMGEVPRYLERTWELPPWQRDHQIGSYPVNALDATDVLRDFGRRLRGLGLDTAGLDRVQAMVGPRALRALREQLTSTGSATGLRVGALGLRPVWLGSRIARLQVELIADEPRFDGLGHGVTFKDGRQATETDETSGTDSRSATAGVNVGEGVRTADKVARAAGPTYAESGTSTQQVTQSRAVTRLRARGVEMDEPHAEYLTGYRLRIGLRLGSDRDVQVEGPVGRLRELVPLSLTVPGEPRSGADPLAAPQVVAPPPAVTVWEPGGGGPREQREALRARIDSWQAASGRGQAATPFRVPPIGFDVRRIVGLDAVRAAGEIALARALGAPIGPRAGQADLSGPGLDEALAKARRTSLTRPGTAPALALHDGTSDTALAAFFDHSTTTEGLRVPGLTDDAFFSTGTRAELSFRSRTDLPGARLLAVMPSATMSGSERLTTSSDVAVTRAGGHEPVPGGGPSLDARSAGTAAPSASGSESTAADGDAVRYGAAAIAQTTRKPKTTRAFLFAIPATWVGVAEVERGFKDSPAGVWMHEHLGPFGPSRPGPQAVSAETQVIAWVREDIARELGLVTDDSFPPRVADAWEKVTRASTAWVDADKAYWKLRRTMPDSRAAYAQAHRDRTLAKSGLTDARGGADEPAARLRLREATARLHELRRELKEKWTGLTSRREAADQAAAEFHRVRAATDRLTRWHRLSAEERAGVPEPPAVDFAAPAATSPARSAGYTVGEGRLTAPDGTGYTLRDVPRDGGSFHHALAEGLRHLARDRQDGDTPAPGQPFTAERLRELLTARLGNAHDTDLLAFTAPDTKDAFGPAELHDAGIGFPDGSPERREYEDTGRLPLHHEPSASERVRLAALQLRRDPDPADPDTWDHGAADLLPALAARALGVRVTVVHGDGRSQDFAPPVQRTSAEHGTGPGERTPHVVLYLADRHFQSVIPDAAPTPAGVARPSMGKEPSTGRSSAAASPSAGPSSAEAGPSTEPIPPPRPTSVVPSGTVGRPRPAHTSAPWTGAASSTDKGRYRVTDGRTLTAPDGTVHDVREPSGDRAGNGFWEALAAAFHREPGDATSAAPRNAALDRAREPVAVVRARPLPASAHLDRDVPFTRDELTRAGVMLDRATARRFQDTGDLLPGHVTLTPGQERALVRTQLHTARHWDTGNEQAAVELAAASYRAALTVVAEDGTSHTHSTPDAVPGRTAVLYRRGTEYLLARPRTAPETAVAAAGARPGGDPPAPDTADGPRPAQDGRPQAPRGYTLTRPAASDGARPQVYEVSRAGQIRTPRGEVLTPHGWVGSGDDYAHLPSGHVLRRATGRIERLWQPAERDSAFDELVARQGDGLVSYQLRAADDGLHVVPTDSEASNGVVFPWRVEDTGHH